MRLYILVKAIRSKYVFLIILAALLLLLVNNNMMRMSFYPTYRAKSPGVVEMMQGHTYQPINVLFVMTSLEDTRYFPVQLKSILYHRSSSLFLHLFVSENILERIMTTLLSTWEADQVLYKIYRIPPEKIQAANSLGVIHSLANSLLPFASKALYMSNDIIFLSDVSDWMRKANESLSLRDFHSPVDLLPCNSSENRCTDNPDLIYLNLRITNTEPKHNESGGIEIGILPCHLIPFSLPSKTNNSSGNNCFGVQGKRLNDVLVVHRKDFLDDQYPENHFHQSIRETVMALDSSEPKNRLILSNQNIQLEKFDDFKKSLILLTNCSFQTMESVSYGSKSENTSREMNNLGVCQKFLDIAHLKRRTQLFYHCGDSILKSYREPTAASEAKDEPRVTLLTVLTLDRLLALEKMLTHWTGQAVILFYLTDSEASYQLPKLIVDSNVLKKKEIQKRIAIHLVYKRLSLNPINYLRNVLLNNTWTSHIVYLDVDLVPNPGIYDSAVKYLKDGVNVTNKLFIIPAFQSLVNLEANYPPNKTVLLKFLKNETIIGYKQKDVWPLGHRQTNYLKWKTSDQPYQAIFKYAFEPYVVVPRSLGAFFNEDLIERMGDKMAYISLIHGMGYDYYVLPHDFIIHLPHPISRGHRDYNTVPNLFSCGWINMERYRIKLQEMFRNRKF